METGSGGGLTTFIGAPPPLSILLPACYAIEDMGKIYAIAEDPRQDINYHFSI